MELRVDLAALRKSADDVHATRTELTDEWETLRKRAAALFESRWTGTASQSYNGPWSECEDGFRQILAGLESLSRSLDEAAQQYQASEQQNADGISRSGGGLNLDV